MTIKRRAEYVPSAWRADLNRLSKADLMEIAWDFAMRTVGEDRHEDSSGRVTYAEIRDTHHIVCAAVGRKPTPIPDVDR